MKRYAEKTDVPVGRSKGHIEDELRAYGCNGFGIFQEDGRAQVQFKVPGDKIHAERMVRIEIPQPDDMAIMNDRKAAQEHRRIWRSLFMVLKAKLESVASGIETFDEAFLPHIVLPTPEGPRTIMQLTAPQIHTALAGAGLKLLEG